MTHDPPFTGSRLSASLALLALMALSALACESKRSAPPTSEPPPGSSLGAATDLAPDGATPFMRALHAATDIPSGELDAGPHATAPIASAGMGTDAGLPENAFVASFPGGSAMVYAVTADDGRTSDVILQLADARGSNNGPARRIRRTSGSVVALSAFVEGNTAWVAWRAQASQTDFGAVMRVALDSWAIAGPRMLGAVTALPAPGGIRVISDGRGGALVATNGAEMVVPCFLKEETPPCRGPSITVAHVPAAFPAREPRVLVSRGLDGGPIAEVRGFALAGLDSVFIDVRSMHGGAITDASLVSFAEDASDGGAAASKSTPVRTTQCGLLDSTHVVGERIVTVADDGYWDEKNTCPLRKGKTSSCPQLGVTALHQDTDAGAPKSECLPLLEQKTRCADLHVTQHLRFTGGELDIPSTRACGGAPAPR